ncbi:hypothetical protein [Polaribacter glomeratus]|uniref:Uncharacterized protein n=1 Tax=Polaribacter glomeratus TaxID=102 RepID=A0A2S7WZ88_9FLAO|nr:hypothetical protein [Polaribacter glomeratus]PQJ82907.1 hypothetical protein BTO16_10100 [Polaribacter glomeratus]TXD64143.1 hypothetical protein ESX12_16395 [Polaribacter glomeratus]
MLKELFSKLFEKLKTEKKNNSKSKSGCFIFFETTILEEKYNKVNFVTSRSLTNYYNKYVEGLENTAGEPNRELKDLISNYLGYNSYTSFENAHLKPENELFLKNRNTSVITKNKILKIILTVTIALASLYLVNAIFSSEENCIIWKENHFEKSSCAVKNSIDNSFYKVNIIDFKKTIVHEKTLFFNNGSSLIWYGKSLNGKMDFFTHRGIHPVTLKELKPITAYIIKKYVLPIATKQQ